VEDDVLVAAALARLLELEPKSAPDEGVDPFAIPGGWRVGEPAWTRYRIRTGDRPPVALWVRGRAANAEVAVGDGSLHHGKAWLSDGWLLTPNLSVVVDGRRATYLYAADGDVAWLGRDGHVWALREEDELTAARHADAAATGELVAPMPGTVAVVHVTVGEKVRAGQPLVVVEAMKMEHAIAAPIDGVVGVLHVAPGQRVAMAAPLATVEPEDTR
ncbi:MAG: acetyl-CoA carboxylase biotin carboxyl carrier protein subunit, partial [Egibacteraceae bacterium]